MQHKKTVKFNRRSPWLPFFLWSLGALFYCYEFFLRVMPSVMQDSLLHTFHITAGSFGLMTAFYMFAYAPMQIPVGVLMDRYGPKRLLIMAALACVVGAFMFVISDYFIIACIGRFLIGFGSAFAFVGVLKIATIWLPDDRFAFFSGLATSLGMIGAFVADNSLTFFVDKLGWRATVWLAILLGIMLTAAIYFFMVEHKAAKRKRTLLVKKHNFLYGLRGLKEVVSNIQIWNVGTVGALLYLAASVFAGLWGIPYFTHVYHMSPSLAALTNSFIFLGWVIGSPILGWLSDKTHSRRLPIVVCSLLASVVMLLLIEDIGLSIWAVMILTFCLGLFSSGQSICFAVAREISPHHFSATALAVTNMLVMMGSVILQPLIGMLLDYNWSGELLNGARVYSAHNYQHAMLILPLGLLIAFLFSLFLPSNSIKAHHARR